MAKYTPTPLTTTLSNSAAGQINSNLTAIATALEKTLSRDGTAPNQMTADLDMNNQDILNAASVDTSSLSTDVLIVGGQVITPTDVRVFDVPSVKDFGAVGSGAVDDSAAILAGATASTSLHVPVGTYLIDTSITIPSTCTMTFEDGAVFEIGSGVTLTWNGGIKAGPYQRIFSGNIVQSVYNRIGDTPYTFGLQGDPKIAWASPVWFGADSSGVSDSQEALHAAQYFGNVQYIPEGSFRTTVRLDLRQNGMKLFGEGYTSKIIVTTMTNAGSVLALRGDPPTTASGGPARYVVSSVIDGIHVDGNNQTNVNGVGGSFAQGCFVRNCHFSNIGRKAVTFQYWCRNNQSVGNTIYEAAQEAGSTHAAFTIEGQTAGLNYTLDGGFNGVDDKLGVDMVGNIISRNKVYTTGYGNLTIQRAYDTLVSDNHFGDASGGGSHVILAEYAIRNRIAGLRCGDNSRRLIYISDTTATDNVIEDVSAGDTTGSTTDGYSIHDVGTRNKLRDIKFDHSNVSTTGNRAVYIEGADCSLEGIVVRSNDATTSFASNSTADRLTVKNCKLFTPNSRSMILNGSDILVEGNYCDAASNATGIQVLGPRPRVVNNRILGNATNRVLVDGTTAAPYAVVTGNTLDGSSAQINFNSNTLFSSVKCNNPGDTNTGDNMFLGVNALWQDATGDLRVMTSGALRTSDTDGVVVGTQT